MNPVPKLKVIHPPKAGEYAETMDSYDQHRHFSHSRHRAVLEPGSAKSASSADSRPPETFPEQPIIIVATTVIRDELHTASNSESS
jgi:hypothetical protein